jgi:hypothetical protein
MLSVADQRGRYARLEELSLGLGKELVVIGKGEDPLLYLERQAYLLALHDALAGVEEARVTLARALQRIDRERQGAA